MIKSAADRVSAKTANKHTTRPAASDDINKRESNDYVINYTPTERACIVVTTTHHDTAARTGEH